MTTPFVSVDYTSRDFQSILADLTDLIPSFMPEWTSRSQNDFGIVMLEMFSYVADGLHFYADRIANESFLETATQRSSLLRLARMLNYVPTGNVAATATLSFTNSTGGSLVVPAQTTVVTVPTISTDTPVTFETSASLTVPANSTATVAASHGVTHTSELLGSSDGGLDQTFPLFNSPVVDGSVTVSVDEGGVVAWSYVPNLLLSAAADKAYTLLLDENDVVSVRFGDGANGKIPDRGASITATYRVGGGSIGNVAPHTLTRITSTVPAGITVDNSAAATGGADSESSDSIRVNAPLSLQALNRAVTLNDYANLAVNYPQVAKAKATSSVPTSVNVYVAKAGAATADSTLLAGVLGYLNDRKPVSTTVTVLNATYVGIDVSVTVHVLPQYTQAGVQAGCSTAIAALFAFDNVIFGDLITPSDIHTVLNAVDGVAYIDITLLDRAGGTGNAAVQLADNEIPQAGTFTPTMSGGIT